MDLLPIYFLVHIAFVFANIWISSALMMQNSELDVLRDVFVYGGLLLLIYPLKLSIKPPTKGVFHCTICHISKDFTVWDFVALALHCGFLGSALIERIIFKREFSIIFFLMGLARLVIGLALIGYHYRLEVSEDKRKRTVKFRVDHLPNSMTRRDSLCRTQKST